MVSWSKQGRHVIARKSSTISIAIWLCMRLCFDPFLKDSLEEVDLPMMLYRILINIGMQIYNFKEPTMVLSRWQDISTGNITNSERFIDLNINKLKSLLIVRWGAPKIQISSSPFRWLPNRFVGLVQTLHTNLELLSTDLNKQSVEECSQSWFSCLCASHHQPLHPEVPSPPAPFLAMLQEWSH